MYNSFKWLSLISSRLAINYFCMTLIRAHAQYICIVSFKWLNLVSNYFAINYYSMVPLYAHAQCICIVYAKYQKASVKAPVQVNFPMYAISKKPKPYDTGGNLNKSQSVDSVVYIFVVCNKGALKQNIQTFTNNRATSI